MANSFASFSLEFPETQAQFLNRVPMAGNDAERDFSVIAAYFEGVSIGAYQCKVITTIGDAKATATVTFSGAGPAATQTCSVGNQTFTAMASGAVAASGQFNVSATPATVAANFAAAVNAVAAVQPAFIASAVGAVVTLTATFGGGFGNCMQAANVNLANTVIVGFTGGVEGTGTVQNHL